MSRVPAWPSGMADKAQTAAVARSDCRGGRGRRENRWLLSGVMRCACCGQPFWGVDKRKGRIPGRKPVVTSYYICSGRCRSGKSVCPHSAHVRADALEAWVLARLREMVMSDTGGVEAAIDRFVQSMRGGRADPDAAGLERELAQIDAAVNTLLTGLDPANLPLINDRLSQLRRRKEHLQRQLRAAKSDGPDEKALRKWATERIGLLAEMAAGRRDDAVRRALASYVDEITIDPATKTGVLVVNAHIAALAAGREIGVGGAEAGGDAGTQPGGSSGITSGVGAGENRSSSQNDRDPPCSGSQVNPIAGARFATNLRPSAVDSCGKAAVYLFGNPIRPGPRAGYPACSALSTPSCSSW
ncbi:MAG: zinc ribbon domain-containing protein [Phycisphaerales bacterium]|nr:zinc ribbon domain-containing protein [Phycisphaerales bacterium]